MSATDKDTLAARNNVRAGGWLLADMCLNIWAISIVKALGAGYPPWQIVFLRALVGLVVLMPIIWYRRSAFQELIHWRLQFFRIMLSALALTTSFFAITQLPLALFMTMNFTRPLILMAMAAIVLSETITKGRWIAAGIGLFGVVIAINPQNIAWSWGLLAVIITVFAGTAAVIVTRQLKGTPAVVMMVFYTLGIGLLTAGPALATWQPIPSEHLAVLLLIGIFAQCAQFCFLRAHWLGDAGFLAPLGYLSLIISIAVGYLIFEEVPSIQTLLGGAIIVLATLALNHPGLLTGARLRN